MFLPPRLGTRRVVRSARPTLQSSMADAPPRCQRFCRGKAAAPAENRRRQTHYLRFPSSSLGTRQYAARQPLSPRRSARRRVGGRPLRRGRAASACGCRRRGRLGVGRFRLGARMPAVHLPIHLSNGCRRVPRRRGLRPRVGRTRQRKQLREQTTHVEASQVLWHRSRTPLF